MAELHRPEGCAEDDAGVAGGRADSVTGGGVRTAAEDALWCAEAACDDACAVVPLPSAW